MLLLRGRLLELLLLLRLALAVTGPVASEAAIEATRDTAVE